jgi:NAD(P)-dependent dehydrogenase (short-subunit alcohol dehydrogenase family)
MARSKPVALVTGGAKGIGRAIARHLLATGMTRKMIYEE